MGSEPFLPDHILQAIAAENNLSETAFWREEEPGPDAPPRSPDGGPGGPDGGPDGDTVAAALRWFTPTVEIGLCGHATLATAHAVLSARPTARRILFRTLSGVLTVRRALGGLYEMDLPCWRMADGEGGVGLGGLGGLGAAAVGVAPDRVAAAVWRAGRRDALLVLDSAQLVKEARPDSALIRGLPCEGLIITAAAEPGGPFEYVFRFFAPRLGIEEDPACGSAQCSLVPYWSARLGRTQGLRSRQLSARGAEMVASLVEGEGGEERVVVAGRAVTVITGTMVVPRS